MSLGPHKGKKTTRPKRPNPPKSTRELQDTFLGYISGTLSQDSPAHITKSAELTGIERKTHYIWLKDEDYAKRFQEAWSAGYEVLEEEMRRRAYEGYDKPVYQGGVRVGLVREYSDTLAMFLAKGNMPRKFVDRTEVVTKNGGPGGRFMEMSNDELDSLIERTERVGGK